MLHSQFRQAAPGVATGRLRPLLRSAVGQLILSLKEDREILALARRINAEEPAALRVPAAQLMKTIEACRRNGHGYTEGAATPGHGIVCLLLPAPPHQPPIAIGIGTSIPKLRENKQRYLEALKRAVEAHGRHVRSTLPIAALHVERRA